MAFYPCVLSWAQTSAEAAMPDLCDIYSPTASVGTQGGQKLTYAVASSGVACRVVKRQYRPDESQVAGKNTSKNRFFLRLPLATVITTQSYVIVTSLSNRRFDVAGIDDASDAFARVCECVEIDRA